VGDVSGKGAPAAIYAALVSGIIRSHAAEEPGPSEMLSCINLSLAERPIEAQFVSIICAIWDDNQRILRIANSGLPRPIYCHNGKVERIEATGLPLGLFSTADYDEFTFHGHPGDVWLFFSDGILDARNRDGNSFGRERVERLVARNADRSAAEIVSAIFDEVNGFVGGVEAFDDQTILALKVKGEAPGPATKSTGKKKTQE
jgi:phosphoserine phosphatase RsbU/P